MHRFLLLIALLGVAVAPACDRGRKARQKARRAQRVECARLCDRSFKECPVEVLVAAGRIRPERVAALRASGAFDKIQSVGRQACLRDCKKKEGRGSDAPRINACLAKKGCKPFADCISRVVQ